MLTAMGEQPLRPRPTGDAPSTSPAVWGRLTRRTVLRAGGGLLAGAALPSSPLLARAAAAGVRRPDSLPDPTRPAGEPTAALPFDHLVVVMMENHSFDNYFGMLARRGQPAADGFSFDGAGHPVNANPVKGGYIAAQRAPSLCQPGGPSQSWSGTHREVNGGRMDGFASVAPTSMLYWDEEDLPFYYSLAKTFTLANRWFCSAPCQTYPNRRFLLAGTAFGLIRTDTSSIGQNPPNGTIFDRLDAHSISWRDYFTDVPATGVIESIVTRHPANHVPVAQFHADCAAGTLPAVSFVDSDIGAAGVVGGNVLGAVAPPFASGPGEQISTQSGSEEGPGNITLGETFVKSVVGAVLASPAWRRTLLVYLYDEHGGYYDHVPPPAAIAPDNIAPRLGPHDPPGGYDVYGPRVPAVVVSAYARPNAVTNVVHDHTSILATIEAKWNLPALTYRDANAATVADFLDTRRPSFPEPPDLAPAKDLRDSEARCSTAAPTQAVLGAPPRAAQGAGAPGGRADQRPGGARHLVVRFYGRRHRLHGLLVEIYTTRGALRGLEVQLRRGGQLVARGHVAHVTSARHRLVLHHDLGRRLPAGRYTLLVSHAGHTVLRRRVKVG